MRVKIEQYMNMKEKDGKYERHVLRKAIGETEIHLRENHKS